MSNMNRFFILIGILLLSINIAYAATFEVNITPVKDKIVVDEVAEFSMEIRNNLDTSEEFTIKKAGYPFWDLFTKPLTNPITVSVPAYSSASIIFFVDPLYITSVDTYTLEVGVVRQKTGEEQKAPITIGIKSIEPLIQGYVPTVVASMDIIPKSIDPRKTFTIKIVLNNQNRINYSNLTVKIESALIKDELHTALAPEEYKIIELTKKFDDMASPQNDRLVVTLLLGDRIIVSPIVTEFEILQYSTQDALPAEQSFLKIRKGVKVTSNNPDYSDVVKVEMNSLKKIFMTTHPKAEIIEENGKQYLIWHVELDNNRSFTAYSTENYRPIVVVVLLSVAAVILYFLFRSPIVVRKGVANVGMSEGGIADVKVVIRVKNRSSKQLMGIELADHVPHIAHVEKELSIGSIQPHAILQHPKGGLILKWTLESLEAGDERVLSYRMKSRLPILGEFNLPSANARCKDGNKVILSNSNRVTVGG